MNVRLLGLQEPEPIDIEVSLEDIEPFPIKRRVFHDDPSRPMDIPLTGVRRSAAIDLMAEMFEPKVWSTKSRTTGST